MHHLSVGSFRLIVLALGVAVLLAFSLLMLAYRQSLHPTETSLAHIRGISQLARQTATARLQVGQF